jgi:pimeloyl-ACP methyl ester carboxylesterase
MATCLFVPGWGASSGIYRAGLPESWEGLDPPRFRQTRGRLDAYREWLGAELARRPAPVSLAGHSMGAALAVLVAAERPELVRELILLGPAGLPFTKPPRAIVVTFAGQVARGCHPPRELGRAVAGIVAAPLAALRAARAVYGLDLRPELARVREHGIPCTVVGCTSDELATPAHCRRLAALLNARYRALDAAEGHIWMIAEPERLRAELSRSG